MLPIHCNILGTVDNHWTLVVRYPTEAGSLKDWDFILVDLYNDKKLARSQQNIFDFQTKFHFKRGTMD